MPRAAAAPATISAVAASIATARASESVSTASSSAAVARQFSGVIMMPVIWQAQCRLAASSRFCNTVTK